MDHSEAVNLWLGKRVRHVTADADDTPGIVIAVQFTADGGFMVNVSFGQHGACWQYTDELVFPDSNPFTT